MTVGPVQMLVLGFEDSSKLQGQIMAEMQRLKEQDIVRLIDAIAVKKDENGEVEVLHQSDLSQDEAMRVRRHRRSAHRPRCRGRGGRRSRCRSRRRGARRRARLRRGRGLVRDGLDPERHCRCDRTDRAPLGDPPAGRDRQRRRIHARRRVDPCEGSGRGGTDGRGRGGDRQGLAVVLRGRRPRGRLPRTWRERWQSWRQLAMRRVTTRSDGRARRERRVEPIEDNTVTSATPPALVSGSSRPRRAPQESELPGAPAVRRHHRRAGGDGRLLLPQGGHRASAVRLHHPSRRPRFRRGADLVAAPVACIERAAGRSHHPPPARNRRAQAGRGIQGIRTDTADRASRHHHRGLRHPQPRSGTRARSTADRHGQRNGRPGSAPDQARRACHGQHGDRSRRQLRCHQHAVGLAPSRSLLADGGGRARWPDARSRAGSGFARCRRWLAHLRRAGRMDRFRNLLASVPIFRTSARPPAPSSSGPSASASPPPCSAPASDGWPCFCSPSSSAGWCC